MAFYDFLIIQFFFYFCLNLERGFEETTKEYLVNVESSE